MVDSTKMFLLNLLASRITSTAPQIQNTSNASIGLASGEKSTPESQHG